ncbi:pyrimidine reductase [Asanoa ishikariensis]|uniref:Dihydrofolate reductase n=1 Tax=Asanoa ishikariensis TaxID=137265 RepID=A0A1H3R6G7_9ACTN|nr:dihydrofolate reductase family protein [Asanoa ishikariensis]GIF64379.1 pyrimidine reductase [Asanoa ishikariensis]SDZ21113.1 Dihydrofolate reductase [Asanoa ishikariensis]
MRTITVGQFSSLDGVVESPEKWHMPYVDQEMMAAIWSEPADTLLLGRVTYDSFAGAFATLPDDDPVGGPMNRPSKVVVSRTRPALAWRNSHLLPAGDLAERVAELKAGPGGPISVVGSISVVRALLSAGLVDRLSLLIHPIVVGAGQRLFPGDGPQVHLTLEKCDVLRSGVTHHLYTVNQGRR